MILALVLSCILFLGLFLILLLPFPKKIDIDKQAEKMVTVLVAARNEEKNIEACLNSLAQQNYPFEKIQIIVGDDDSTDQTLKILKDLTYPNLEVYSGFDKLDGLNGKANVLAQIDQYAKGEVLLFTDADTIVSPNWVKSMVASFTPEVGISTGMTVPKSGQGFQGIDWIFALTQVIKITALGIPTTSMGNNMAVSKKAYKEVGGYKNIKNTLTEDFEIFHRVINLDYDYRFVFQKESLIETFSIQGILPLLYQRKRWMTGAVKLPFLVVLILLLLALFYPVVLFLLIKSPWLGFLIWSIKAMLQILIIGKAMLRLELKIDYRKLFFYELYSFVLTLGVLLFYVLPIKVKWKERVYD